MNTENNDPVESIVLTESYGEYNILERKQEKGEFFIKDLPPCNYNLASSDSSGAKLVRKKSDMDLNEDALLKEILLRKYGLDYQNRFVAESNKSKKRQKLPNAVRSRQ